MPTQTGQPAQTPLTAIRGDQRDSHISEDYSHIAAQGKRYCAVSPSLLQSSLISR
jgi:hypothetical protein